MESLRLCENLKDPPKNSKLSVGRCRTLLIMVCSQSFRLLSKADSFGIKLDLSQKKNECRR